MTEATKERTGAIRCALSRHVVRRSVIIALVVGSLLTLGNHFDVLLSEPLTVRLGAKILMNFFIPFVVSSTSAAMNRQPSSQ